MLSMYGAYVDTMARQWIVAGHPNNNDKERSSKIMMVIQYWEVLSPFPLHANHANNANTHRTND